MSELLVQRHEEKYLLNPAQAAELKLLLGALLHRDSFGKQGSYWIRSLYFDTPEDGDFADKVLGLSQRRKIRLRLYDIHTQTVKLEIKNKSNQLSLKQTASISRTLAEELLAGHWEGLMEQESTTARRAYTFLKGEHRAPAALVDYRRTAFVGNVSKLRITFDEQIQAAKSTRLFSADVPMVGVHSGGVCVLEVKYDGFFPAYLRSVLSSVQPLHISAGKYEMARQILY